MQQIAFTKWLGAGMMYEVVEISYMCSWDFIYSEYVLVAGKDHQSIVWQVWDLHLQFKFQYRFASSYLCVCVCVFKI